VSEAQTQVLVDYLTGACGNLDGQSFASQISRLVVLGNSLAPLGTRGGGVDEDKEKEDRKPVRHMQYSPCFCLTRVVQSADMGTTTPPSHLTPSRTFLRTWTTCPNHWQFTFFPVNPILRVRLSPSRPSHGPCLAMRLPLRPSHAKQIPPTSALLPVHKEVTAKWIWRF
jgi:hypothetical protein